MLAGSLGRERKENNLTRCDFQQSFREQQAFLGDGRTNAF